MNDGEQTRAIELVGVRVHNLKNVSLRVPLQRLTVITGVSGSGKSSLAFDTLFAEGQRRYIESFSPYARQFLDPLEKPDADRIDNLPPAIAVRQRAGGYGGRSTIATTTEIYEHLRLLFARIGQIVCPACGCSIASETADRVLDRVREMPAGARIQLAFPLDLTNDLSANAGIFERLMEQGFRRVVAAGRMLDLNSESGGEFPSTGEILVVVDRITVGRTAEERIGDSVELAFQQGEGICVLLVEAGEDLASSVANMFTIDDRHWRMQRFSQRLVCDGCGREFLEPDPRLFSFNAPLGACPKCEGFGSVPAISLEKVVPNPSKTLRDGAIVPWTTPSYRHELDELLAIAGDYGIPVDVPFAELTPAQLEVIREGVPERRFGGLNGFFGWLERHRYKLSVAVFLSRWRLYQPCPACRGDRLRPEALAVRIGGRNISEMHRMTAGEAAAGLAEIRIALSEHERRIAGTMLKEIETRLRYLSEAGLGYLTLDRAMRTLSAGETRRVALTAALGSSLVNMLYVLDEPSAGLHPRDTDRVIRAVERLRDQGNTVVVVEHETAFLRAADYIVDIGPGAGQQGGEILFTGSIEDLDSAARSLTADYLAGRRSIVPPSFEHRRAPRGWLTLEGARQHNLKNLTVEFPLGVFCVVAGVSGSGKSTLVQDTLYPALCRELRQPCEALEHGIYERLIGAGQVSEIVLVDESPIGRTPRSVPATYLKIFDDIRKTFAETAEARLRHLTPTHFSFNAKGGGRCTHCEGSGTVQIDMQFLPDVTMTCPECHGTRYERNILDAKYRGLSIADVLSLTAAEAFTFFRSQRKVQRRLKMLKDVGLEYLPLGQPATTLSGGESQRLKLASYLADVGRPGRLSSGDSKPSGKLFLLEEPTTGLHPADVAVLLSALQQLVDVGHSLIVIEHHLDVIRSADYVIELGPEAAAAGGRVIATGPPEELAGNDQSTTGELLAEMRVS